MAGTGRGSVHRPLDRGDANPVLVVGNSFDPATPYAGAQKVADLLPNSRLLTYAGWGHTACGSGNFCVVSTVVSYLITRQVPAEGTVCQPGGSPFGPQAARRTQQAEPRRTQQAEQGALSIQAALIPDILRTRGGRHRILRTGCRARAWEPDDRPKPITLDHAGISVRGGPG